MVGHATCKLLQRIALIYLKPVVAKWRYKKSRVTILSKDVKSKDDKKEAEEDDYESDFEVPDKIEDILATLLENLSAQVCFSFSKSALFQLRTQRFGGAQRKELGE